jgi:predicted dehydrogenase
MGTAVVYDWDCTGKIVQIKEDAIVNWDNEIVYTAAGPTRTMAPRPQHSKTELKLPNVSAPNGVGEFYKNFAAAVEGVAELAVKPEQCLRVMKVIDLLFESNRAGHGLGCSL